MVISLAERERVVLLATYGNHTLPVVQLLLLVSLTDTCCSDHT